MGSSLETLAIVAGVLLPVAALVRAWRRGTSTAHALIGAPVRAGAVVNVCFLALVFLRDADRVHDLMLYPYAVGFTVWGGVVGLAGLLVRRVVRSMGG